VWAPRIKVERRPPRVVLLRAVGAGVPGGGAVGLTCAGPSERGGGISPAAGTTRWGNRLVGSLGMGAGTADAGVEAVGGEGGRGAGWAAAEAAEAAGAAGAAGAGEGDEGCSLAWAEANSSSAVSAEGVTDERTRGDDVVGVWERTCSALV